MKSFFSHYIVVSSEDNTRLVKGGIGTYLGLLCNFFSLYKPDIKIIWLTESPSQFFFVLKKKNVRIFYFPKNTCDFKKKIQKNCLRFHKLFSKNSENKIGIEAPDWEGLLSDLFKLDLGSNTLKITRLHSVLELTRQSTPFFLQEDKEQISNEHEQILNSDLISAPTRYVYEFTKKLLDKKFNRIPHCIIPNFINSVFTDVKGIHKNTACKNFNTLLNKNIISPSNINVFCIGSLEYRKGTDLNLKIAESVIKKNKNAHFYFLGHYEKENSTLTLNKKYKKTYLESIIPSNVSKNIHICGYLEYKKLIKVYNACDTFLFSYRHDNFPGALIEACLSGINVVYLARGGCKEIMFYRNRSLGIGFNGSNDSEIIRNGTRAVLTGLENIGKMSSKTAIQNKYKSSKIMESICKNYVLK